MTETPDERPRPTPRPRPGAAARPSPSPRPRVAGSRRDREETEAAPAKAVPTARPTSRRAPADAASPSTPAARSARAAETGSRTSRTTSSRSAARTGRRIGSAALVLALLCLLTAAGAGFLLWQRLHPSSVDTSVLAAARSGVQALYAYDYRDSEGSVERKLAVLTGELREQYETDLSDGGIIDTYEQVSATTSYEVVDVGLQQINEAQDTATLVVFGKYVVESVNSGDQPAPEGSECQVTPDVAQLCTQTVQVRVLKVDGEWKISELTLLTTS